MSKYIVFKRSDWNEVKGHNLPTTLDELEPLAVDDAEVIRHQDITAASIFYHYASTVESYAELSSLMTVLTSDEIRDLRRIADHFAQAADAARHHPAKRLPTI